MSRCPPPAGQHATSAIALLPGVARGLAQSGDGGHQLVEGPASRCDVVDVEEPPVTLVFEQYCRARHLSVRRRNPWSCMRCGDYDYTASTPLIRATPESTGERQVKDHEMREELLVDRWRRHHRSSGGEPATRLPVVADSSWCSGEAGRT